MKHPVTFAARAIISALLIALLVIILRPDLLARLRPVVEFQENTGQSGGHSSGQVSYADAVAAAAPAVVTIYSTRPVLPDGRALLPVPLRKRFFGEPAPFDEPTDQHPASLGSGVLVSPSGYILTNFHVIENSGAIRVSLPDGRSAVARLIGSDRDTDLAVLQIDIENPPSITLGSSAHLRVGDVVMAIGNPFSVGQTVTLGIISATGRSELGINTIENFIQTDAAINPGNSGGGLINAHGDLVGINTAIFSRSGGSQGIGFAIPIGLARGVMRQIIENGEVIRGWFGIQTGDVSLAMADAIGLEQARGVLIADVFADGPAHRSGLQTGDVITHIGDQSIANGHDLLDKVIALRPGTRVMVRAIRDGQRFETRIEVNQRPSG